MTRHSGWSRWLPLASNANTVDRWDFVGMVLVAGASMMEVEPVAGNQQVHSVHLETTKPNTSHVQT